MAFSFGQNIHSDEGKISRRGVLIGAGVGVGLAAIAGGAVAVSNQLIGAAAGNFAEPEVLKSKDGLLDITITASYITKTIGGKQVKMMAYNGSVPGPTLWLAPGDKLRVKFVNQLGVTTNLHTHGLHVSPEGNGDNPMIMIHDGESFHYEYQLPQDHPSGTYWYHPHHHGEAANQVFGGLYGVIIVDTGIGNVTDHVLVISDVSIATDGSVAGANMMSKMMGREGDYVLVNGAVQPQGRVDRGQVRWHIINACVSRNLNLNVAGAKANVIGLDGHRLTKSEPLSNLRLSPGNRAEVVMATKGGDVSLNYTTVPHPDSMGMMGNATTYKNYPLVTFKDSGKVGKDGMLMWATPKFEDLRKMSVAVPSRSFTLNMPSMGNMGGMGGMGNMAGQFTINGNSFDPNRIDTPVKFGAVEEWTILNNSTMAHPFHLHVWPMQILQDGSKTVSDVRYQDVVSVPAKGQVKVRVRFADFKGTAVYHCHILDHEDLGMMGIIQAS